MLPDDVFLEIFDFYVTVEGFHLRHGAKQIIEWITLAHVCRRWRNVVFQSQRRLNLRLLCTHKTRTRDILDIWPRLPLSIHGSHNLFEHWHGRSGVDNIVAALEHNDRVCQIKLVYLPDLQFGYVTDSAAMRKPFPKLTDLQLRMNITNGPGPILPDTFLGGTALRLQSLFLDHITFPGLPKLLLSATHLVYLYLYHIPHFGYIPPEVMATILSALTSLESLRLNFRYPRPRPALGSRRLPPPLTRSNLPKLTKIRFKGASEYLEEILARIDVPRLDELLITFFNQIIFDTPQLFQFISRRPALRAREKGLIIFNSKAIIVKFPSGISDYGVLSVQILSAVSEWQHSSLEQVCTSSLSPLSTLEDLYIFEDRRYPPRWQGDVENTLWLDLLRSFVAVKNLNLSREFVPRIAPALQELVGGRTTEVFPTLENIFLEDFSGRPLHKGIEKFVAARRLTSRPVAVSCKSEDLYREIYQTDS